MSEPYVSFSYKPGNSFVHKMPVVLKILLIPALNILFFNLPFYFSAVLLVLQFVLCCVLKFTIREQLKDFKPIIYYAFLLYLTTFIANFCSEFFGAETVRNFSAFIGAVKNSALTTFANWSTAIMLLKLFCVIQCATIVFRTSTSLQIRQGIGAIESFVRKRLPVSKKNKVTNIISMFICFIPMVYKNWQQCKRAWYARGGKKSLRMYMTIFPVFFSVGIKQSWNTSRAVLVRE